MITKIRHISVKETIRFLENTFAHKLDTYNEFIYANMNIIVELFGQDGFLLIRKMWHYDSATKWTFYYDTVYFKHEDDLILFRMKFG